MIDNNPRLIKYTHVDNMKKFKFLFMDEDGDIILKVKIVDDQIVSIKDLPTGWLASDLRNLIGLYNHFFI